MSLSMCISEMQPVRELALELFKADRTLAEDFRHELRVGAVTDELLKETGCWSEAEEEMRNSCA